MTLMGGGLSYPKCRMVTKPTAGKGCWLRFTDEGGRLDGKITNRYVRQRVIPMDAYLGVPTCFLVDTNA